MLDQLTSIRVIRVFVASPGDVSTERGLIPKILEDLNLELERSRGARLECVRWETHVYPDVGHTQGTQEQDAQQVINRQVPPCEIFIGIMWGRFGTPTRRFGSGTAEEFQIAYERSKREGCPKILFYFRDEFPSLGSKEQLEQFQKVEAFRETLRKERGLVWTYKDNEEFVSCVRRHLILAVDHLFRGQTPVHDSNQDRDQNPADEPRRFTAFVASVRDLLKPVRAEILEELSLRDIEILQPSGDQEATRALMSKAHVCIHLLDGEYHPAVDEQLDMGGTHARRQILWLSPRIDLSPQDPDPYRRKLLALQSRDGNFDFMRCRNETQEIVERVECLKQEWFKRNSRGIFFNIHGTDKRYAKDLFQYLKSEKDIEPFMNEDDLGEPSLREFDEKASRSRAIVVFYGAVSAAWVIGRLGEVVKLIFSKGYPVEKLGIYVAPPPKSGASPIRLRVGLRPVWMDNTQGFDPRTLEELFSIF